MPLIKIGKAYYNEEEKPIYLLQGNATRDGEWAPVKGKDHGKVSVAAYQTQDGSTVFVTVNGWRGRAGEVAAIRKMDSVLAVGVLKKREYEGRYYYDLDADFVSVSGVGGVKRRGNDGSMAAPGGADQELEELVDEDGELPF